MLCQQVPDLGVPPSFRGLGSRGPVANDGGGTPRVTDMSWGTRCGTGLPARNSPMVGTSVPVPGILSHDISFHTHLPGLSIVLGFNLQHRMGRWSQEGSVRHVGGSPWLPTNYLLYSRTLFLSFVHLDFIFFNFYNDKIINAQKKKEKEQVLESRSPQGCGSLRWVIGHMADEREIFS